MSLSCCLLSINSAVCLDGQTIICAGNLESLQDWCKRKFEGRGPELDGFFKEVTMCDVFGGLFMLTCALDFREQHLGILLQNGFTDEMEEFH